MVNEKMLFGFALVAALAFFGFVVLQGTAAASDASQHQIDESIPQTPQGSQPPPSADTQVVRVRASSSGYDNPRPVVKAGVPVRFEFTADRSAGCCAQVIVDGVGVNLVSRNGETVSATFTPPAPGEYRFHCGMNMCRGVLVAE